MSSLRNSPSCVTSTRLKIFGSTTTAPVPECSPSWKRAERMLGMLLKLPFLTRTKIEPILNAADRTRAQRMVYQEYLKRQYCAPNSLEMHFHYYGLFSTCKTLCLKNRGKLVGTVSVIVDSPAGLPFGTLFPDALEEFREMGKTVAEVGLLALDCGHYRKGSYSLQSFSKMRDLFELFRSVITYANKVSDVSDLVILVHPRHENLYRYIGFQSIGPVRDYEGAEGNAALPMSLCLSELRDRAQSSNVAKFLLSGTNVEELSTGMEYGIGELLLRLAEHPTVWPEMSEGQRALFVSEYPRIASLAALLDAAHAENTGPQINSEEADALEAAAG